MPTQTGYTDPQKLAQKRILEKYKFCSSWRKVAEELKENPGYMWNVGKGKKRACSRLLKKLGIPLPALAPAPVCPVHGVVHARLCRSAPAWVTTAAAWLAKREKEKRAAHAAEIAGGVAWAEGKESC